MFLVDRLLLLAGLLMILGIVSSKFSARIGMPVLVLFLGLGMLAGSDGIGKIPFDDYELAHAIGTVALAFILFDGGLRSPLSSLRVAWKPAAVLATLGVLLTSAVTGLVAVYALDLSLLEGLLLGSIVGSTDAAAVFGLLRSAGLRLRPRLGATLEIESGANDPMAIFLTIGLIQVLTNQATLGPQLVLLFVLQMGVGLAAGLGVGVVSLRLTNRINLAAPGLYPVLTASCGVFAFGLAAVLQGSGFLAIYVAGLVLGNNRFVFQRGTLLFHDGIAWAGQIAMFVVLGLLSYPSELIEVSGPSLLVAAALVLVARPIAVMLLLWPFRYTARELALISWVGLKGAVPIILATYPLMAGIEAGSIIFDVVFFVVLLSAIVQGGTLPWVARLLRLDVPPEPEPPLSLEISSLREVDAEIVDYLIASDSRAAGRTLRDLALPEGAVAAMITRGKTLIPPRGSTELASGDHVFIVVNRESRAPLDRVFSQRRTGGDDSIAAEFPLRGSATVGMVAATYGVELGGPPDSTLEQLILAHSATPGQDRVITTTGAELRVREVRAGRVLSVALRLPPKTTSARGEPSEALPVRP